ncbi:MAG: NADP-dependent oxidoreductase [Pseudomonadales bacterium]|jgi:NADPH-dependent curcumin reductase CurA
MNINRQWLLASRPNGMVSEANFDYVETPIPEIQAGEVLVRNLYLSFDPTQRGWMTDRESYLPPVEIGAPMRAGSVGQVMSSQHPDYAVGQLVQTTGCWQDYVVAAPGQGPMGLTILPENVSPEMMLSVFGITGLTAYFGLLDIGDPKPGETVLVSGAAGATGSVVGQIAKIKGCRVVGIAGGAKKCAWLKEEGGFDDVIDYKSEDVGEAIQRTCPDRVDVFFDNVGGAILEATLDHIALHSRIVMCGAISGYNSDSAVPGPKNLMNIISRRTKMQGFIILDYIDQAPSAIAQLGEWIAKGQMRFEVDVQTGFENIPATLKRLFTGENMGKQLLKIADPV